MIITKEQVKALGPCEEGFEWYAAHGSHDLLETLLKVNGEHPDWARWLYTRLMSVRQRRLFAVFAAEQVLPLFEKRYPGDARPRKAIEAACAVLEEGTEGNRAAARNAAANAADAADAAAYAADANANAAYAAYATNAAAYAAAYAADAADAAANAAANAADAADAAAYARKEMQERLIHEAVRILGGTGGREGSMKYDSAG